MTKEGIPELWEQMKKYRNEMNASGDLERIREQQHKVWMWNHIRDNILQLFRDNPSVKSQIERLEQQVSKGAITSGYAADKLLHEFSKSYSGNW